MTQPEKKDSAQTELASLSIANAVRIERVKAALVGEAINTLEGVSAGIVSRLAGSKVMSAKQASTIMRRLSKFSADSGEVIQDAYRQINEDLKTSLTRVATKQSELAVSNINKIAGFELAGNALTEEEIATLVDETLILGATAETWLTRQAAQLEQKIMDAVRDSLIKGETDTVVAEKLLADAAALLPGAIGQGAMRQAAAQLETLIRTATAAVAQQAKKATYEANSEVVRGMQWVSILDSRTTPICFRLNGLVWDMEGTPLGHAIAFPGFPPIHWNCRSTVIPVLKPWSELSKGE